jgi:hypothetical protein
MDPPSQPRPGRGYEISMLSAALPHGQGCNDITGATRGRAASWGGGSCHESLGMRAHLLPNPARDVLQTEGDLQGLVFQDQDQEGYKNHLPPESGEGDFFSLSKR